MATPCSKSICFPGGEKLQARALADEPRQALRSAHAGNDTKTDFRQADPTPLFLCNADIASHRDLKAAALSMAVNGRYYELRRVLESHEDFMSVESKIILER